MSTLSVRVRYRPLRIGWCVRHGDWEQLLTALKLTHTLWGGRFNPIIPVGADEPRARQLIDAYRVDGLLPIERDPDLNAFANRFPWLHWPILSQSIFIQDEESAIPTVLDIYHPVERIFEKFFRNLPDDDEEAPPAKTILPTWEPSDPLAAVLTATFGAYPTKSELRRDYFMLVLEKLRATPIHLDESRDVPADLLESANPSEITRYTLSWDRSPNPMDPGFYIGRADDFDDVVNFWNIRAADIELYFYDPSRQNRLGKFCDAQVEFLRKHLQRNAGGGLSKGIAVWSKDGNQRDSSFSPALYMQGVQDLSWASLTPPLHYIDKDQSILGSVSDEPEGPMLAVQLPPKPLYQEDEIIAFNEHLVVTLSCASDLRSDAEATFCTPAVPELNEFYRTAIVGRR